MTLLNWEMTPDYVLILSDTLSLDTEDKRARSFTTKVYPAPHIEAVVTGTGIAPVVTNFYLAMNADMVVEDVVHLSQFAPALLSHIWNDIVSELPSEATTTIYTFGIAKNDGNFTGFAYRSTNGFQAEQLQHGMAMKPGTSSSIEDLGEVKNLEAFVALTRKQQAQDRESLRDQRVGIGGDLWMYFLSKTEHGVLTLKIKRLERMLHYDSDRQIMLSKLQVNASHPLSRFTLERDP